jgi:hypothetical protein
VVGYANQQVMINIINKLLNHRNLVVAVVALFTFVFTPVAYIGASSIMNVSNTNVSAEERAGLQGGDIMRAYNHTQGTGEADPIDAAPGNILEYRLVIQNVVPDTTAHNVRVKINVPGDISNSLVTSANITADDADPVFETTTVNVTGGVPQRLEYEPNHVRLYRGSTAIECFNSSDSFCATADNITSSGIVVADSLAFNESVQVFFKLGMSNFYVPSPSPSVAPSPSPSVAPSPSPSVAPSASPSVAPSASPSASPSAPASAAPSPSPSSGTIVNNNNNNNSQTQNNNQTVNVTGGTTTPVVLAAANQPKVVATAGQQVSELPKTGLPLAGWALAGLLPLGAKLRRFGKTNEDQEETANFIWEERELKK